VAQYFNPLGAVHTFKPPALPEGMTTALIRTFEGHGKPSVRMPSSEHSYFTIYGERLSETW